MGIYWVIHQKPIPPILRGTVMWLGCIIRNVVYDRTVSYQFINFSVSRGMNSFRTLPLKIMDFAAAFDIRGISLRLIHYLLGNMGHIGVTKSVLLLKVPILLLDNNFSFLVTLASDLKIVKSHRRDSHQSILKFYCSVYRSGNGTKSFNKNRTNANC